tara:strand:+ start:1222 stop:1881 length:660 start_codon:yes stop_codon:yes gene_type:complete
MSLAENPPPPLGPDWKPWGERLVSFLSRTRSKLANYIAGESAFDDGVILWDRTGYPVVSKNGEYRQIVLADGYGEFAATSSITAAQADTAYTIAFTSVSADGGVSINGSDNTKIMFAEAGVYSIQGHLQLKSSSGSTKTAYYWLSVNGTDIDHSERITLHDNNAYAVLGVNDQINIAAGSYLQAKFAVTDTALWLDGAVATSFAPASQPIALTITRSRQ